MPRLTLPAYLGILILCAAIFALGQFHRASGSVFVPILMDRFALPALALGGLVSVMFIATIAAQLPLGAALDRFGPRRLVPLCLILVSLGTALFATADSLAAIWAARVLIGLGLAAMGAASHVIIAHAVPARDFGYVSGLVVTLGGIGGLLGTYPLALALQTLPWGTVFGAAAVAALALAFVVPGVIPRAAQAKDSTAPIAGFGTLLRRAALRRILVMGLVTYAPITTLTGLWGGPFLQDAVGLDPGPAGAVLFVLFGATIAGGAIFGMIDRRTQARRTVIATAVAVSCTCLATLALLPDVPIPLVIALLLGSVFAQQFYIPLGAHLRSITPLDQMGRAAALQTLCAVAAIPLMQLGFGAILDLTQSLGFAPQEQYRSAFGSMALVIALCGAVYLWPERQQAG
ncbi:MAG: MFS transporter [Pseudomonadota bacterium]